MSSTNIIIPIIIIVVIIIVSIILFTRNSDSAPVPPPVDEFTLDSAKALSINTPDVSLTASKVTTEGGQTFKFPGTPPNVNSSSTNPRFIYSFATKTDLSDLRTVFAVEYTLTDPNNNFIPASGNGTVTGSMFYNISNQFITASASTIEIKDDAKKIYKIKHIFNLSDKIVDQKTFEIRSIFTRTLTGVIPTDSTLSEVKMYEDTS